jgi:hypothetical protein
MACEQAKATGISEDELRKNFAKIYPHVKKEQISRLLEISKRIMLCESRGIEYVEALSAIFDLTIAKPMDAHEELKKKYDFESRNDNWLEKQHWLKPTLGSRLFHNLGKDGPIISQAITVKEANYKEERVVMITTDTKWILVRHKLSKIRDFIIIVFKRRKLKEGGSCVRL